MMVLLRIAYGIVASVDPNAGMISLSRFLRPLQRLPANPRDNDRYSVCSNPVTRAEKLLKMRPTPYESPHFQMTP
jgi:hypothetical protein